MLNKLIAFSALYLLIVSSAAQTPSTNESPLSTKATKVQQAMDLMDFAIPSVARLGQTKDLKESPEAEDLFTRWAENYTRDLDPTNKSWNRSHPKWKKLVESIKGDIRVAFSAQAPELAALAYAAIRDRFSSGVSEPDLDTVLAYFSSPNGKRYLAFLASADKATVDATRVSAAMLAANRRYTPPQSPIRRYSERTAASSQTSPEISRE